MRACSLPIPLSPVFSVASKPIATVSDAVATVEDVFAVYRQNQDLREENDRLLHWQEAARRLAAENADLRGLIRFAPQGAVSSIAAQVIANSGGAFLRNVMVNVGSNDGVQRGQSAMTGEGLVGRVVEVGNPHVADTASHRHQLAHPGDDREHA